MKVNIIGSAITKFGETWDKSLIDLAREASINAIKDSGIKPGKIEAVFVSNMLSGKLGNQGHLGPAIASSLFLHCPAFRIEGACASGGLAVHLAVQSILARTYENVLVIGVEKMTDATPQDVTDALMNAGCEEERTADLTFPGLYALLARAHMQTFGTTQEQLAEVAIKNHYHASLNKNAQFPFEITMEKALGSPQIASPLTLLDSSPISDGAAAVVLSSKPEGKCVRITGSAVATDTLSLSARNSLTGLEATKTASRVALKQASAEIGDINLAEVHDCFTIAEILAMEDLGLCAKGEGGPFIQSKATYLGGKLPVNTSGGLKACGHPVGATGVKQIVEIKNQLLQRLPERQVKNAKIGLAHNVGGTGATAVVHILQI